MRYLDFNLECLWSLIHICLLKLFQLSEVKPKKDFKKIIFYILSPLSQHDGEKQSTRGGQKQVKREEVSLAYARTHAHTREQESEGVSEEVSLCVIEIDETNL